MPWQALATVHNEWTWFVRRLPLVLFQGASQKLLTTIAHRQQTADRRHWCFAGRFNHRQTGCVLVRRQLAGFACRNLATRSSLVH